MVGWIVVGSALDGGTELAGAIPVNELTARPALEIVPSLHRLDATGDRVAVLERPVARRTQELWRRVLRRGRELRGTPGSFHQRFRFRRVFVALHLFDQLAIVAPRGSRTHPGEP